MTSWLNLETVGGQQGVAQVRIIAKLPAEGVRPAVREFAERDGQGVAAIRWRSVQPPSRSRGGAAGTCRRGGAAGVAGLSQNGGKTGA